MTSCVQGVLFWRGMLLLLAACVGVTLAGFEQRCSGDISGISPRGICGPQLSQILSMICKSSGYNGKRSVAMAPHTRDQGYPSRWRRDADAHSSEMVDLFLPRADAVSMLNKRGRGNRYHGIICECCINQCQINELTQYCAASKKKRSTWMAKHLVASARNTDNSADQIVNEMAKEQRDRALKQRIGLEILKNPDNWWTLPVEHYQIRDTEENELKRSGSVATRTEGGQSGHWLDSSPSVNANGAQHKDSILQEKLIERLLDDE